MARNSAFSMDVSDVVHDLKEVKKTFSGAIIRQATARALSRSATSGRVAAIREVQKTYKIRTKFFTKSGRRGSGNTSVTPATRTRLISTISTWGKPIPIREFRARQTKRGVSLNIKGKRTLIPHAFFATMPAKGDSTGYRGVFARGLYGKDGFVHGKKRMPITKLVTLSQGVMMSEDTVVDRSLDRIGEIFPSRFKHEIDFIVAGLKRKTAGF